MNDYEDRENLPGDEPDDPEDDIPEISPDDPDYEYYTNMMKGFHLTPGMQAGFKIIPDGQGGFTNAPMSPEEQRMFMDLLTGNVHRYSGAPHEHGLPRGPAFEPIRFPHYYFLNREYVIQFINGVSTEGSDVTMYIEVIKNPRVTQFRYSLIDAYEKLQDNQFLTFLLSLRWDLYLWNPDGVTMRIVQNQLPMYRDEKIVIIAKCSKERPEWINHMDGLDFVKGELADVQSPFADQPIQVYQNVSVAKHIYEPIVRAEGTFAFGSNGKAQFTDEDIDMYSIYNRLVMPMIIDAVENFYPSIKVSSSRSRKTCNSVHLAYETRISDYMLTIIFYMAPAYLVDTNRNVFGFMPLGEGLLGITNDLIGKIDEPDCEQETDILRMLHHMHSSQDSQTLFLALMGMGNIDVFNTTYGVQMSHSLFFLFHKFPTETMGNFWTSGDEQRNYAYMCSVFPSQRDYIMRYMVPNDVTIVPSNPEHSGNDDPWVRVYGFFEVDITRTTQYGLRTFAEVLKTMQEEMIAYMHMEPSDFEDLESESTFNLMECWCAGHIIRFAVVARKPLKELVNQKYVREVENRIEQIRGDMPVEEEPPHDNPPPRRSFFRKR